MAYIGSKPTDRPLTSADLAADLVTGAKIADDAVDSEHLADDCINSGAFIADDVIDSEHYAASSIDTAHIDDDQVTYAKIQNVSATNKILGRDSASAGVIEEISPANVVTMLGIEASADVTDATNVASAGAGMLTADQSWSGSQRGTPSTVTDGTLDLDTANNFQYTPAGADVFEFTNEAAGQSGFVKLINPSAHAISVGSEVKKGSSWDVSTAGTYLVSYYTDGTNVYVSASEALS